jgi:hypothetical protein
MSILFAALYAVLFALLANVMVNLFLNRRERMTEEKQTAILENWSEIKLPNGSTILTGVVFDHPKLRDGSNITTSEVQMLDRENSLCTTLNTHYTLAQEIADFDQILEVE